MILTDLNTSNNVYLNEHLNLVYLVLVFLIIKYLKMAVEIIFSFFKSFNVLKLLGCFCAVSLRGKVFEAVVPFIHRVD